MVDKYKSAKKEPFKLLIKKQNNFNVLKNLLNI